MTQYLCISSCFLYALRSCYVERSDPSQHADSGIEMRTIGEVTGDNIPDDYLPCKLDFVNDAVRMLLQFQTSTNITATVASTEEGSVLTAVQLFLINIIMDTCGESLSYHLSLLLIEQFRRLRVTFQPEEVVRVCI